MTPPTAPSRLLAPLLLAAALALGSAGLAGCTTNPATGEQIFTLMSEEDERRIGAEQHPKMLAQFGGVYRDDAVQAYVAEIGARLVANSEQSGLPFTFTVLDSPVVNAFALPGGYVYITRGLMALADSEAELAGVLGHEIAHVTARHGAQQQTRSIWVGLGAAVLGAAVGSQGAADLMNLGGGLILRGYSREQEFEADSLGLRYLTRAGYQPDAVASFLARLREKTKLDAEHAGTSPDPDDHSLLSTHPRTIDRVQEARAASIGLATQGGRVDRDGYLRRLDGMIYGDSPEQGFVRGHRFVHPVLRFAFTVPDEFALINGTTSVQARAPNGAAIVFDAAHDQPGLAMLDYVARRWGRQLPLTSLTRFESNGMEGTTGIARLASRRGPIDIRLVALRGGDGRIYRFVFVTPADDTARQGEALRRTALSFRLISATEAAQERPYRLRVREARAGETVAALSGSMPPGRDPAARFRVLNGLAPGEEPTPGRLIKLVQD